MRIAPRCAIPFAVRFADGGEWHSHDGAPEFTIVFRKPRAYWRMAAFGHGWPDTTAAQVYCVYDIHPFMADEIVRRGAARCGLTWHFNRPPVIGLDYEMDCRSVAVERSV